MTVICHNQLESTQSYYDRGILQDQIVKRFNDPIKQYCDFCGDETDGDFDDDDYIICSSCEKDIPELIRLGILPA